MPREPIRSRVRVRSRHEGELAWVEAVAGGGARVEFEAPVRAVSPGQAAVFYGGCSGEEILGGGWIAESLE